LLTGQRVYFTGVVSEAGSILRVPRDRVGEVIEGHGDLGAFLLQEMFRRRQMFLQSLAGVQIVGSRYSPDTQRLREFAARKTNYLLAMIGAEPHTEWLPPELARNEKGFILTGDTVPPAFRYSDEWSALGRAPYLYETSLPGVFAVGDVRAGSVKRVAAAAGEGSMAVRLVQQYLGLVPA